MTINRSKCSNGRSKIEQRRLRLRDWLEIKIDDPNYPGLEWVNQEKKIFRIPWKHGARHGWREEEDARLFREWSHHTGASPRDVKQHKANFRCALNSLRDVTQVHRLNKQKGNDAYRVYQMLPKKKMKQGSVWIRKRKQGAHSETNESCAFATSNPLLLSRGKCEFDKQMPHQTLEQPFNQPPVRTTTTSMFSSNLSDLSDGNQKLVSSTVDFPHPEINSFVSSSHAIDTITSDNIVIPERRETSTDTHSLSSSSRKIDSTFQLCSPVWNLMKDANETVLEEEFPQQNNFSELSNQHSRNTLSSYFCDSGWDTELPTLSSSCNSMPSSSCSMPTTNSNFSTCDVDYSESAELRNNFFIFAPSSEASNHSIETMKSCSLLEDKCDGNLSIGRIPTPNTDFVPENENVLEKTFSVLQSSFGNSNNNSSHQLNSEYKSEDCFVTCNNAANGGRLPSASTLLSPWPISSPQTEFKGGLQVMSLC